MGGRIQPEWVAGLRRNTQMTRPNRALGGNAPEQVLDTDEGLTNVLAILERIKGGVIG
jgi:uncharacterized protein (DUF2384 family)